MNNVRNFIFFLFLVTITLCASCHKENIDPNVNARKQADRDEIILILNSNIQTTDTFDVYIFSPPNTDSTKYKIKTNNHDLYFADNKLITRVSRYEFNIDEYAGASIRYKTRTINEPRVIKRMEISFRLKSN